jgi:hypothetical protein
LPERRRTLVACGKTLVETLVSFDRPRLLHIPQNVEGPTA